MADANRECERCEELLPFLLNGTLSAGEQSAVRDHLEGCDDCRAAAGGTARVWELFALHPDAEELSAFAFDEASDAMRQRDLEAHLAICTTCSEDVALARASRGLPPLPGAPSKSSVEERRGRGHLPLMAIAAAGVLALGVAIWSWWSLNRASEDWRVERAALERRIEQQAVDAGGRVASGDGAGVGGPAAVARLQRRIDELTRPQPNVTTIELFSGGDVLRSRGADAVETVSVDRSRGVSLLLLASAGDFDDVRARFLGSDGSVVHEVSGLERQPTGEFSLYLPASALPAGEIELELEGLSDSGWRALARHRLNVSE